MSKNVEARTSARPYSSSTTTMVFIKAIRCSPRVARLSSRGESPRIKAPFRGESSRWAASRSASSTYRSRAPKGLPKRRDARRRDADGSGNRHFPFEHVTGVVRTDRAFQLAGARRSVRDGRVLLGQCKLRLVELRVADGQLPGKLLVDMPVALGDDGHLTLRDLHLELVVVVLVLRVQQRGR